MRKWREGLIAFPDALGWCGDDRQASAVLSTVTQTVNAGFAKLKHALNELATMQRDALERILQRLDTIWVELQRIDQAADLEWLLQRCINTPDSNVLGDIKEAVSATVVFENSSVSTHALTRAVSGFFAGHVRFDEDGSNHVGERKKQPQQQQPRAQRHSATSLPDLAS